jgi:glycosyltransferase involved in cell wall biosynthesis
VNLLIVNWQDRHNPQAGGAEIHLHEIFGRLAGRGHDVALLASGWKGAARHATVDGIDVHRVGGRHSFALHAARYYRRRLRRRSYELLIEDLNKIPLFVPAWTRRPVVLLVHHLFGRTAFSEASLPIATATWLLEKPLARAYRDVPVQAVSESTAADLAERGFRRAGIRVIPNGVDTDFYAPAAGLPRFDEPTVLYLGRLKRYKRIDLIVRAVAALRDRGVPLRLRIGGRGSHEPELRRLVAALRLDDRVDFAGFVSEEEKRQLFRRCWVHVLTSEKEGWGISNLEAAACGTPTVASDSPGLRDSVRHGETGFLVPHGDVEALADRLAEVLGDARLRERLGTGARRFAEYYAWDRAADETEAHLSEVLGRCAAA